MRSDEQQLVDMVIERNSYEKQALDTIAENEALKAQVNVLRESLVELFNGGWDHKHSEEISDRASVVLASTPEQCLATVKIEAVEFAATQINGQCDGELCQEILTNYIEELRDNN